MENVLSDEYYLLYLRKSRQDNENETVEEVLARHETQLQDFAIRLTGAKIKEENIYREIVSGETIEDRPKIKEVLTRIQDPNCKGVIVIEPQRLTRGDLIDLGNIIYAFRFSKTLVLTPSKNFNLENKYDREFFERELLRGKDYIEYTKEILARGRNASAKEGNWISSSSPYGYSRIKISNYWTLEINEEEANMVRLVFDLYVNKGYGAAKIAHHLNDLGFKTRYGNRFAETAIRQILTNEVYIGKIRWNAKPIVRVFEDGKIVKKRVRNANYDLYNGKHEPIISEELFKAAQERKGNVTRERTDLELRNILAGILKCKKCGGTMAHRIHRKNGVTTRKDRYYCRTGIYCDNKSINAEIIIDAVIRNLKMYLEDFKIELDNGTNRTVELYENMLASYEKELKALDKKQEELYDLLENKIYTQEVFLKRNKKLALDREELMDKIKTAKLNKPTVKENERKYYSLFEALNALEDPHISAKAKNTLLKDIIEVIYYERNSEAKPTKQNSNFELEIILK